MNVRRWHFAELTAAIVIVATAVPAPAQSDVERTKQQIQQLEQQISQLEIELAAAKRHLASLEQSSPADTAADDAASTHEQPLVTLPPLTLTTLGMVQPVTVTLLDGLADVERLSLVLPPEITSAAGAVIEPHADGRRVALLLRTADGTTVNVADLTLTEQRLVWNWRPVHPARVGGKDALDRLEQAMRHAQIQLVGSDGRQRHAHIKPQTLSLRLNSAGRGDVSVPRDLAQLNLWARVSGGRWHAGSNDGELLVLPLPAGGELVTIYDRPRNRLRVNWRDNTSQLLTELEQRIAETEQQIAAQNGDVVSLERLEFALNSYRIQKRRLAAAVQEPPIEQICQDVELQLRANVAGGQLVRFRVQLEQ